MSGVRTVDTDHPGERQFMILVSREVRGAAVPSLDRGLEVLANVCANGPTTAESISRDLGLPLSTTYRYIADLRSHGYVAMYEGYFDLGVRMLQMLHPRLLHRCLAQIATPIMFDLVGRTGESIVLTVRDGWNATCIELVEPRRAIRLSFRRGVSLPLHAGASAKPLLAHMAGHLVDEYINRHEGLVNDRPDWPDHLRGQLAEIRRQGVIATRGEIDPGVVAIGVPIFWDGRVAACLSVAGPGTRFNDRKIRDVAALVRTAGDQLSELISVPGEDDTPPGAMLRQTVCEAAPSL